MSNIQVVDAQLLDQLFHWLIVDIRQPYMRKDPSQGFIPGSLNLLSQDEIVACAQRAPVVLSCAHGDRSLSLLSVLPPTLHPVIALEGGQEQWIAQGLPMAGIGIQRQDEQQQPGIFIYERVRELFNAQLSLILSEQELEQANPLEIMSNCLHNANCSPYDATIAQWEMTFDLLAVTARDFGAPSSLIASDLDAMLRLLHAPSPALFHEGVGLKAL